MCRLGHRISAARSHFVDPGYLRSRSRRNRSTCAMPVRCAPGTGGETRLPPCGSPPARGSDRRRPEPECPGRAARLLTAPAETSNTPSSFGRPLRTRPWASATSAGGRRDSSAESGPVAEERFGPVRASRSPCWLRPWAAIGRRFASVTFITGIVIRKNERVKRTARLIV